MLISFFQSVQTNFINYARKQIDKSEVNEEIRLRSPSKRGQSPRGSVHGFAVKVKRPSLGNILSQVPYLQQHLSEANLSKVSYHQFNVRFLLQSVFVSRILNMIFIANYFLFLVYHKQKKSRN